jgi:ABC-type uncharacterized transport system permease subunit
VERKGFGIILPMILYTSSYTHYKLRRKKMDKVKMVIEIILKVITVVLPFLKGIMAIAQEANSKRIKK